MKKVQITVTEDHIKNGVRSSNNCPIALALKDAGFRNVYVGFMTFIDDNVFSQRGNLPTEATQFIFKFDKGLPVEPITFEVEVHDEQN